VSHVREQEEKKIDFSHECLVFTTPAANVAIWQWPSLPMDEMALALMQMTVDG